MSIEYKPEYIQKLKLLRDKSINLIYEQRNDMKYYPVEGITLHQYYAGVYRDWETDRKSTRLNSSHITRSRMPSSA